MPITQERLRDLLEEHETWINALSAFRTNADSIYNNPALAASDKLEMLYGETLLLRDLSRTYAIVERRDLNRNWKLNQRLAAKQQRKRRAAGIVPRGMATETDWVPHEASFDEAAYAAHNADPANQANSEIAQCMTEMGLSEPPSPSMLENWRTNRAGPRKITSENLWGASEGEPD